MLTYGEAGLVVSVTAILVSAVWRSLIWSARNPSDKIKCHTDDHPQRTKAKPPGHRYSNYDHPTEKEHRTAEQFNWRDTKTLNVCIAVAAAIAALFAAGSFYETRRQAVIAEETLKEARKTNIIAADTEKRQLRAYIGLFDSKLGPDGGILVQNIQPIPINIRNTGQTPAYDAQFVGAVDVLPFPLPLGQEFKGDPQDTAKHPNTIYPSSEFAPIFNRVRRTFSAQDLVRTSEMQLDIACTRGEP